MTPYQVCHELKQRFGPADGDGRFRAGPHVRVTVEDRDGLAWLRVCCADERVSPSIRFTEVRTPEQFRALVAYLHNPEAAEGNPGGAGRKRECDPASARVDPPRPPAPPVPPPDRLPQRRAG
jgi:hypothetical protein